MDTVEALDFLRHHQPLPEDAVLPDDVADRWFAVLEHFRQLEDERSVPLLIGSLHERAGFGFTALPHVLELYPWDVVRRALEEAMSAPRVEGRMCAMDLSCHFPDRQFVPLYRERWRRPKTRWSGRSRRPPYLRRHP